MEKEKKEVNTYSFLKEKIIIKRKKKREIVAVLLFEGERSILNFNSCNFSIFSFHPLIFSLAPSLDLSHPYLGQVTTE